MKFHEDVIFKNKGQKYGQELLEIINVKGKIVEIHQTEYSIIDPKMYKPDLVFELEDKIVILEFQSTYVDVKDKRRFRFYTALFDLVKIKSEKPIEVHVLSTSKMEKTKWYSVNQESRFPIYIHSLKNYNGDEFLNRMKSKIESNKSFSEKELLMISLLCFMDNENDIEQTLINSALTITNIKGLNENIGQFAKGVILLLSDKFVKNESTNETISNLVGGNMKIVEDYAQRKVDEVKKEFIINLEKKRI
ncbi:hypothetical protein [Methanobrevibacter sp.]|uniref:hypothetical protein n=1 Tax=Methanobrevibacter sp. TaxID=66852 RepID=UPI00389012B0